MKKDIGYLFVLVVLLLAVLSACAVQPSPPTTNTTATSTTAQPQSGGILKPMYPLSPAGPFGWPAKVVGASYANPRMVCIEPLIQEDNEGKILPWLATSWEIAPDGKSVTFTLRKGVKFHDGTDFNAEAVKYNLDAVKAAKKAGSETWISIDVINDYTVRLSLSKFQNSTLNNLVTLNGLMASPTAFKTNGEEWAQYNPVGTGPFKFVNWKRDVNMVFTKFPDYWQKGRPYLDGIEYIYIPDLITRSMAFQQGQGHYITQDMGKEIYDLLKLGFEMQSTFSATAVIYPDSARPGSIYADKRVREAVEYAIDKEAIAKAKGFGYWKAAYQTPPEGSMAFDTSIQPRKYDPVKAKQLLKDAGYPEGFKTKIISDGNSADPDILVALQGSLQTVGITAEIESATNAKWQIYRSNGWENALLWHTVGKYPNYLAGLELYYSTGTTIFPSLKRPDGFLTAFTDALTTSDEVKMKDSAKKLSKLMYDDLMGIPIYSLPRVIICQKQVHDLGYFKQGQFGNWLPSDAWLSK